MFRYLAALALVGCALCAPVDNYEDIPAQYKELIPEEAAKVLKELTAADKEALKAVALRYKEFKSEEEGLAALKEQNAETYEKVAKLHQFVKDKVNALGDEAKAFAKEVIGEARKIHAAYISGNKPNIEELKGKANEFITKFKALSEDAKADFQKQFPLLTSLVKNEKFQAIAKGFLGAQN